MVDATRVAALLHRIGDEVRRLRRAGERSDEDLEHDPDALPAAKYRLLVAVEAATDVADHIIASEGLRPAVSMADSFRSLQEAGWLSGDLAARLQSAAGFRNLLVHQYADVDDRRVIEIIRTSLDDLEDLVTAIASALQRLEAGE